VSPKSSPLHAMVVLGTRPEAIKLAPVVHALRARKERCRTTVVSTGQHREMLGPMLELFGIAPDADLDLQRPDQTLEHIISAVLAGLPPLLERERPDVLVVQGDTSTTFAAALAAFYHDVPVAHVEAGLRTREPRNPFPEEMNRRLTSRLAALHLAPTPRAEKALAAEGIGADSVVMTGNTVVDALDWLRNRRRTLLDGAGPEELAGFDWGERQLVAVTGHRRESFGEPFRRFCQGLLDVAEDNPRAVIVYPVHLNPRVQAPVREILADHPRIHLLPPVSYPSMIWLLERAALVITDSGGIQEEAPSFGVPVLVTRQNTERMEAVDAGVATLVGTDPQRIRDEARRILRQGLRAEGGNPFGDGHAASRCVDAMIERFVRA